MSNINELFINYLSAYNEHDLEKILTFLDPNCRVIYDGKVWVEGLDALKSTYEKDFLNPNAKATIVEYRSKEVDRIHVCLETDDQRLIDVTYVFDLKGNSQKMIEHLIHSVESNK